MKTTNAKLAIYDFLGMAAFFFPLGGVILPAVFGLFRRGADIEERNHLRQVMNFQISLQIYSLVLFMLLPWELAFVGWAILSVGAFMIMANIGFQAANGQVIKYPLAIPFFRVLESPPSYEELMYEYEQSRIYDEQPRRYG